MRVVLVLCVLLMSRLMSGQPIRQIGSNQGLEHPSVYAIAEDEIGFVWLGTRDGLYRFNDGITTKVNFLDSTDVRRTTNVQSLCVSKDSILWVGLQQGGIVTLDLSTLRPRPDRRTPQLPIMSTVVSLYEDSEQTLWAGTVGDGIYRLKKDDNYWSRIPFPTAPEDVAFGFDFAQQGDTLWIGTSGSRLMYWDLNLDLARSAGEAERYSSYRKMVDVSGTDVVWAVEEQGVYLWESGREQLLPIPKALNENQSLFNPRDVAFVGSDIWVSTDGAGLWRWNGNQWFRYTKNDPQLGVLTDQFYNITELHNELWVGSFNGGVTIVPLVPSVSQPIRKPGRFIYTSIQSALTLEELGDELWVGFDGEGLVRYTSSSGSLQPLDFELEEQPRVITSMHNRGEEIWIGTFNEGLFVTDAKGRVKRRFVAFSEISGGLGNNNIWSLESGLGDTMYVGTLGGLYIWDGTKMTQPWSDPWALGRNILDIERVGDEFWVGTEFQGIYKLKTSGKYTNFDLNYPVLDIHEHAGAVYVGTEGGGLYKIGTENHVDTLLRPEDYASCYAIEDHEGSIFTLTSTGLLEFSPESGELLNQFSQESLGCGLFNRKALRSVDDHLYVGGSRGLVEFLPRQKHRDSRPEIIISNLSFDNDPLPRSLFLSGVEGQSIDVPAGNKTIELGFEVVKGEIEADQRIEYRVVGLTENWAVLNTSSRSVSLSNLDVGSFEIQFRIVDTSRDDRAMSMLSLVLNQQAFYYQTWWFKLLVGIAIFLGFAGIAAIIQERKLRETKLNLLETEKELLATKASAMEAKAKEKSDELNFQLLKTSSRVELLKEFKDRLEQESSKPNRSDETVSMLRGLIRELGRELQSENYWDHFEKNYRDLHDAFSEELIAAHPKLTKGEIRLSYLIRQKMNNKEIATVLNVSPAAVEKAKYRLKKKVNLDKTESLDAYIQGL